MISPTSTTEKYAIQPPLLNKHRKILEWLSATVLWKRELAFFQKILDQYAPKLMTLKDKQQIDHFQNLITYYKGEVVDALSSKLRLHEKNLAEMLAAKNEANLGYSKEHDGVMSELESFNASFLEFKEDLFDFIEKVM